jgi:hypothetical protein
MVYDSSVDLHLLNVEDYTPDTILQLVEPQGAEHKVLVERSS